MQSCLLWKYAFHINVTLILMIPRFLEQNVGTFKNYVMQNVWTLTYLTLCFLHVRIKGLQYVSVQKFDPCRILKNIETKGKIGTKWVNLCTALEFNHCTLDSIKKFYINLPHWLDQRPAACTFNGLSTFGSKYQENPWSQWKLQTYNLPSMENWLIIFCELLLKKFPDKRNCLQGPMQGGFQSTLGLFYQMLWT